MYNQWQLVLIPVVSSSGMTYAIMVSVPAEEHNRDSPQASLILRVWVRDSHHSTGGNLPSYFFVGESLQKSKLQKVNLS
jgi:hypothetical protein